MSPQLLLTIVVVIFVVGWFAAGTHYNVRKGEQALRWLQQGLPLIGEKTTLRWLGSSIAELKIQQAKAPFRSAEILIVLEPRDVAPLWLLARARGRRDLFVFRGTLQRLPHLQLEARDPKAWALAAAEKHDGWAPVAAPAPLTALAPPAQTVAPGLIEGATFAGASPVRLAIRQSQRNLEAQWRLEQLTRHSAGEVLQALRRLSEQL